jgi:hypothetical protein
MRTPVATLEVALTAVDRHDDDAVAELVAFVNAHYRSELPLGLCPVRC